MIGMCVDYGPESVLVEVEGFLNQATCITLLDWVPAVLFGQEGSRVVLDCEQLSVEDGSARRTLETLQGVLADRFPQLEFRGAPG